MQTQWRRRLRFLAAVIAAVALAWTLGELYCRLVVRATNVVLGVTETKSVTALVGEGSSVEIHRAGLREQRGGVVSVPYLVFNTVTFLILAFVAFRRDKSYARSLAVAMLLLFVSHVGATWLMTKYLIAATAIAQGSLQQTLSHELMFGLQQGYTVVGAQAIAIALWWMLIRRGTTPAR